MHHINNSAKLVGWSVVRPASWRGSEHNDVKIIIKYRDIDPRVIIKALLAVDLLLSWTENRNKRTHAIRSRACAGNATIDQSETPAALPQNQPGIALFLPNKWVPICLLRLNSMRIFPLSNRHSFKELLFAQCAGVGSTPQWIKKS